MAMSRFLPQSLSRSFLRRPTSIISHHRHRSNKTNHTQFIELEIDQASSSQIDSAEISPELINLRIKKLEDAIHKIAVRRATPDWLPFLPGYSYWVPPRGSAIRENHIDLDAIQAIGELDFLLGDDRASTKGWPSSAFYVEGNSHVHPIPVVDLDVKIQDNEDQADNTSNPKEEEG